MISRRRFFTGAAALAAYATLPARGARANTNGTIPGAIRWDAWYGGGSGSEGTVNQQVSQSLGPATFQPRAPWFASPISPFLNSINGNQQATMDAEITYAASAGLAYWAYCWYGQETPTSPMQNAWSLHQSSSIKNNMNWCMILQFSRLSSASMAANQATYVSYFQQANHQTVTATTAARPLLYILMDTTSLANFTGGATGVATAITNLRAACTSASIGNPYVVIMYGTPSQAASWVTSFGADAISNYSAGSVTTNATPWATFEPTIETFWATMAGTGTPIIPICMDGFDQRPRKLHPPSFSGFKPNVNMANYVVAPTASQLTAHLQAAVSYVVANPTYCPSKAIIMYAWDECDEFGCMMPTYNAANPATPITTALNAVGAVTW